MSWNPVQARSTVFAPEVEVLRTARGSMTNYNYLVIDPATRRAVLVDPAWQTEVIEEALLQARAELDGILLTHSHPDHIDLAKPLAQKYGCPLWMSRQEIAASGFRAPELVGIEESAWWVGQMLIRPLLTPGHTPGCVCYLIGDNLFTGDVLFAEGCGICPGVDAAHQMFDSLQRLKRELRPQTRIYPGHSFGKKPGQLFADVLQENIYLQFRDKQGFAAFRLRPGQSRAKLFEFH
ncbi:hydroxyacylglutathione hydrolase [Tahibacter aquaticus]|uniref:Hydroxyacylglutathione hydrolase n=1 Tax=Tahibacter aquaticus TaxID=520092 RepID=A0A4V3DL95_9GAMM|nr:MBL fold metallo-hydrolase [Tahibacter aquaticus]TDR38502.1 hydroxyacylglutathione hydrolase [Tahibacter aquaticus]